MTAELTSTLTILLWLGMSTLSLLNILLIWMITGQFTIKVEQKVTGNAVTASAALANERSQRDALRAAQANLEAAKAGLEEERLRLERTRLEYPAG